MTRRRAEAALAWLLKAPIHAYRLTFSAFLGHACRYRPTCSEYALEAIDAHGPAAGAWLALRRLARCHPWGGAGHDPVPPPRRDGGAGGLGRSGA